MNVKHQKDCLQCEISDPWICLNCCTSHCLYHMREHMLETNHHFCVSSITFDIFCIWCGDVVYHKECSLYKQFALKCYDNEGIQCLKYFLSHSLPVFSISTDKYSYICSTTNYDSAEDLKKYNCSIRGICDMGNTCYMNSVLQVLLHITPLKNFFLSDKHSYLDCFINNVIVPDEKHKCAACVLRDLFFYVNSDKSTTPLIPYSLLYTVFKSSSSLSTCDHQDVQEFYLCLFELLHQSLIQKFSTQPNICTCIIHTLFGGVLTTYSVNSTHENDISKTYEDFFDISLAIPFNGCTLYDCLNQYIAEEVISNSFNFVQQTRYVRIKKLPVVLFLRINRIETVSNHINKDNSYISFPITNLDFTHYVDSTINDSYIYDLFACIVHTGNVNEGHYVSYVKIDNKWFLFDNLKIHEYTEKTIENLKPYILVYIQKTVKYSDS
ncbi:hypothetical protein WA158_008372 [Blastocystis sp. Blastoise]